jgi:MoxR-like ATPase
MEEKKVTIGDKTLDLPSPFVVFATQNPLEHEGTYPLPEAQLDRFLMRIILDYPSLSDEKQILMHET